VTIARHQGEGVFGSETPHAQAFSIAMKTEAARWTASRDQAVLGTAGMRCPVAPREGRDCHAAA